VALAAVTVVAVISTIVMTRRERQRADDRLEKERQLRQERDQWAEAYLVQVILRMKFRAGEGRRRLVAYVVNHGGQTITEVHAQFILDGKIVEKSPNLTPIPDQRVPALPIVTRMSGKYLPVTSGNKITPFDAGLEFATDQFDEQQVKKPGVIVGWTDRWGTRWENRDGQVLRLDGDDSASAPRVP
jgi:hypothetical protein